MNKKIILDFETNRPNPATAEPIEATFLFIENDEIVKEFSSKLFSNLYWEEVIKDQELYDTLVFNGIKSESDLENHDREAKNVNQFMLEVMTYIKEFTGGYWIALTGWNNSGFDNLIFRRIVDEIEPGFYKKYIQYQARDIYHNFRVLENCGAYEGKLNLQHVHTKIIGTLSPSDFHKSRNDCIAVLDLDRWFTKVVKFDISLQTIKGD